MRFFVRQIFWQQTKNINKGKSKRRMNLRFDSRKRSSTSFSSLVILLLQEWTKIKYKISFTFIFQKVYIVQKFCKFKTLRYTRKLIAALKIESIFINKVGKLVWKNIKI